MKFRLYTILFSLIGFLNASAQQTKLLTAEKHNEYGLVYTLPKTGFQIEVTAQKTQKVAGPFSKYAKVFTSDAKVIDKDETLWKIESVKVTPVGVADSDPESQYLMQLKAGAVTFIEVAESGMLLSINKEVDYQRPENVKELKIEGIPVSGKEYLEFVDEDFISAISSYKKAQLLAEEIMEVREAKLSLTRGTAETMPTDGRQLELMLESLEKQERALINAFTGSEWREFQTFTYMVNPEGEGRLIVCRLDPREGLMDKEYRGGEPLYLTVVATEEPELPVDAKGEEKKLPKDAVVYCIPGYAEVALEFAGNKIYASEFPMSQFGIIFGLNPSIFTDKKEPSFAIFDPTTGGLRELGTLKP
ncbi:MAG: DUF4831 family protein [Muribaculaceae bacterium]|nr:DUF4831 family protein [Muribaculaceae bacterium]